jgi:hypothetical protein
LGNNIYPYWLVVKNKQINILISGNLSTTPRAKQFIADAREAGFIVQILVVNRSQKWAALDKKMLYGLRNRQINIASCWSISYVLFKLFQFAFGDKALPKLMAFYANSLFNNEYPWAVFSSGGFYAAPYLKKPPVFMDVEDYYPGEDQSEVESREVGEWKSILRIPKVLAFSSLEFPKTAQISTFNLVPNQSVLWEVKTQANPPSGKLKLVWFGQVIGERRGLQSVITALIGKKNIELHLIGQARPAILNLAKGASNIIFHGVLDESSLAKKLIEMDLGLNTDLGENANNELLWSNKLSAYHQSALPVLTTKTTGSLSFCEYFKPCAFFFSDEISLMEGIRSFEQQKGHFQEKANASLLAEKGKLCGYKQILPHFE